MSRRSPPGPRPRRRTLLGKRAIVTGASGGIGRAVAIELAGRGVSQVLVARSQAGLKETALAVHAAGGAAEMVFGDVTDRRIREAALRACRERFGGADLLVNNAGVSAYGRFAEASPDRLRRIMEVNFFAAAEFLREATPTLQTGDDPLVVNIGSILGCRGLPLSSEYSASKFALHGLSESVRPELARLGIELLLVAPGSTDTEFKANVIDRRRTPPWAATRGVPAARVARSVADAIVRRRRFVIPNRQGWWMVMANRLAPWLIDRFIARHG